MVCPERLRFAGEYYWAVDAFLRSVQALIDLDGAEFHRAYEISEKYRVAVEIAREVLNHHLVEHGC
jgi:hypothetical protein